MIVPVSGPSARTRSGALLLILCVLIAMPALAGTTFDLLRMDLSPRGAALGAHSLALMNGSLDASAAHPAGLAMLDTRQLSASYADHPLDVAGGRFTYGYPFDAGYGTLSLAYMNYGSFTRRSGLDDSDRDGTFSPTDLLVTAAFAHPLPYGLQVGAAAKFIRTELDTYSSTAVAADVSAHWVTGYQDVELAAGLTNLGAQLSTFGDTREDLPTTAHVGIAKQLAHLPLKLSLTGHMDADDTLWGSLAGEFTVSPILKLRAGYTSLGADYEVGGGDDTLAGISAGLGLTWNQVGLDYAFHSQGALGQVHRLGLGYVF